MDVIHFRRFDFLYCAKLQPSLSESNSIKSVLQHARFDSKMWWFHCARCGQYDWNIFGLQLLKGLSVLVSVLLFIYPSIMWSIFPYIDFGLFRVWQAKLKLDPRCSPKSYLRLDRREFFLGRSLWRYTTVYRGHFVWEKIHELSTGCYLLSNLFMLSATSHQQRQWQNNNCDQQQ